MNLSFNLEPFLALLKNYNLAIWPMQVVAYMLGIAALLLTLSRTKYSGSIISAILGFFWLWTGGLFNFVYFRQVYPLAIMFAVLFVIQGGIFVVAVVIKPEFSLKHQWNVYSITGFLLALYAMAGYPILENLWGRGYPRSLPFGLVPCPTTLFTLALFLLADKNPPWYVVTIPITYAICGIVPFANGIHEDMGLVVGGLATFVLILYRNRTNRKSDGLAHRGQE